MVTRHVMQTGLDSTRLDSLLQVKSPVVQVTFFLSPPYKLTARAAESESVPNGPERRQQDNQSINQILQKRRL